MNHHDSSVDFIGIGAHRAGTTWLWANLRKHPDIWMPPKKELHYFDRSLTYPSPNFFADDTFTTRLFGAGPASYDYRQLLKRRIVATTFHPSFERVAWEMRYLFGDCSVEWYSSLFRRGVGKVKGEITPAYAILNPEDVERISRMFPRLKIIFVIRNPIDRAWSHIRKRRLHTETVSQLIEFLNRRGPDLRGDYTRTFNIWRHIFSKKQFWVGFYDDIELDPTGFLANICDFLGVRGPVLDAEKAHLKVNASECKGIPPELELYLTDKYFGQIKRLSDEFCGHATEWLRNAEQTIRRPRRSADGVRHLDD